jgi:hypothetical protein
MPKTEPDLTEFFDAADRGGVHCWYSRVNFTQEQRERLDAALSSPNISNATIAKVLSSWGKEGCGVGAVRNHRVSRCACG